jgi:hypothetical protein
MKKLLLGFLALVIPCAAYAQQVGSSGQGSTQKSTASAPTYVEGSSNPLSGDLAGNLRVYDSTLAGLVSTAIPAGTNNIGVVYPYALPASLTSGVTAAMTGTTSTSLIAAPGANLRNYVTQLVCTNSHASVGTFVLVQDGSGGTTIYNAYAAAVGGGFALTFPAPLRQPTLNTALYVQDVTTGANVICSASGFSGG